MTYQEVIDAAKAEDQAFATFPSLTSYVLLGLVSEAINKIQKKTHVIKKNVTVPTASLDANGSAPLDRSITIPVRVLFTPTGGTPIEVTMKGPDEFNHLKIASIPYWVTGPSGATQQIYGCVEQNRLWFWPWAGLQGAFTLLSYAKMPMYNLSAATDPTSYWYGWDQATIGDKLQNTLIPQEMEGAEDAIVAYVAARLLTFIPGWKRRFEADYQERMIRFTNGFQDVVDNAPSYPENYSPHVSYGF